MENKNTIEKHGDFAIIKIGDNNVSIDMDDIDIVSEYRWCINVDGYAVNGNSNTYLHILIHGKRNGSVVDHLDQNKLNNRRDNLRFVSKSLNSINSKINKNNKTGFKGVFFHQKRGKFIAYITLNKKRIHFGYFDNIEDAIKARLKGELEYFKENSPQKHLFKEYEIGVGV